MFDTLAALLFAHVFADFVLQPACMAAGKARLLGCWRMAGSCWGRRFW